MTAMMTKPRMKVLGASLLLFVCLTGTTTAADNGNECKDYERRQFRIDDDTEKGLRSNHNSKLLRCEWAMEDPEARCDMIATHTHESGRTSTKPVRHFCAATCGDCSDANDTKDESSSTATAKNNDSSEEKGKTANNEDDDDFTNNNDNDDCFLTHSCGGHVENFEDDDNLEPPPAAVVATTDDGKKKNEEVVEVQPFSGPDDYLAYTASSSKAADDGSEYNSAKKYANLLIGIVVVATVGIAVHFSVGYAANRRRSSQRKRKRRGGGGGKSGAGSSKSGDSSNLAYAFEVLRHLRRYRGGGKGKGSRSGRNNCFAVGEDTVTFRDEDDPALTPPSRVFEVDAVDAYINPYDVDTIEAYCDARKTPTHVDNIEKNSRSFEQPAAITAMV